MMSRSTLFSFFDILVVLIPLLLITRLRNPAQLLKIISILFLLLLVDHYALSIRGHFHWKWQGKLQEILWPLILVFIFKWMSPKEVGYPLSKSRSGWLWATAIGLAIAGIAILANVWLGGDIEADKSALRILYLFTLPGLAEETVYRGVFLAFFNRYFPRSWDCLNVKIGWGVLFSSLLFAAAHAYSFGSKGVLWHFDVAIAPFFVGLILGWLREKTGSIWPCVLAHNFANGFYVLGRCIMG